MKLYELSNELDQLISLCEAGELSASDIADTLEAVNMQLEDKVRSCLMLVKQFESNVSVIDVELDRLKSLKSRNELQARSIKNYVSLNMKNSGKEKLDLGLFKVTLRAAQKVAFVADKSKIPNKYLVVVPESTKVDMDRLLRDLKLGPVDGAELIDGKRALLIK